MCGAVERQLHISAHTKCTQPECKIYARKDGKANCYFTFVVSQDVGYILGHDHIFIISSNLLIDELISCLY